METISTFIELHENSIVHFFPPEGSEVVFIEKKVCFSPFSEISRNF
jgi:hypothetical protein